MHIITLEGSKRLRDIWKSAGTLEIPGCVLFTQTSAGKYVSQGETRQDIPRNSRESVPFPCAESATSIDFHTHPRDARNIRRNDLVYLSPPSASDVSTRILLASTGENATAALVLAEEGIYIVRNTTQWSKRVTQNLSLLKRQNAGLIDYAIFLMRQQAAVAGLLGVSVNARTEAIARLPTRAARDAVVVESLPSIKNLITSLRKTLEESTTEEEYRQHARKYGVDIVLHPYDKQIRFEMVADVHESRWADNDEMRRTLEQLVALDNATFQNAVIMQAYIVGEQLRALLPTHARPTLRMQLDDAFARSLEDPARNNRTLVYRGGSDMSLRLVRGDAADLSPANAFTLLDSAHDASTREVQDLFEMRLATSAQYNTNTTGSRTVYQESGYNQNDGDEGDSSGGGDGGWKAHMRALPPFPPLSTFRLPSGGLTFLEITHGDTRTKTLTAVQRLSESVATIPLLQRPISSP